MVAAEAEKQEGDTRLRMCAGCRAPSYSDPRTDATEELVGWFRVEIEGLYQQQHVLLNRNQASPMTKHFCRGLFPFSRIQSL